jgi:4-hydroxybenzoate polyprenyltransferase
MVEWRFPESKLGADYTSACSPRRRAIMAPHVVTQTAAHHRTRQGTQDTATRVNPMSRTQAVFVSLRPRQWTKNVLVLAGIVFGRRLFDPQALARAALAFAVFCILSGVVYLINDVADRDQDREHPLKMHRPVASGALSTAAAIGTAGVLAAGALAGSAWLGWEFLALATAYVVMFVLYSMYLKHFAIVDVLVIAIGFVLRAAAGAVAVNVEISHWLLVCTLLLALFMALGKRRHELVLLADVASLHRRSLGEYEPRLLDQMIAITAASALIAYIFYTINPDTELRFGTHLLGLTIPFPVYGVFRYLYLIHRQDGGGSPADTLLLDRPLLACVALWGVFAVSLIYRLVPLALGY